jgi:glycosyltransferase involved in cell wall biosynthesis
MRELVPVVPIVKGGDLNPLALWRIRRALRRIRPDVVLTLMKKDVRLTAPVARWLGVPVVVRHANDQPLGRGPFSRLLYGVVPALHVTNAAATRHTLLDSAPWLPAGNVGVIYNGIDLEPFDRASPADLGVPADGIAVGYVGSLRERKGVRFLAEAWQRVAKAAPRAWLVIVGEGPEESAMRGALGDAPRVRWLGYRDDIPAVMRSLDLLVLPSLVEGAPNVVLEAMAASLPVVATAASGTPELVADGETGWLVPPGDSHHLAAALVDALSEPERLRRAGMAGRARAERSHRLERMVDRYEMVLRRVAEGARGAAALAGVEGDPVSTR